MQHLIVNITYITLNLVSEKCQSTSVTVQTQTL